MFITFSYHEIFIERFQPKIFEKMQKRRSIITRLAINALWIKGLSYPQFIPFRSSMIILIFSGDKEMSYIIHTFMFDFIGRLSRA
jgi:hypothetical protein